MDEFVGIEAGLRSRGIGEQDAIEMELWQIGIALGVHLPQDGEVPEDPHAGFDPIKARVEAHRRGLPQPTAPPTSRSPATPVRTLRPVAEPEQRGA